ncbi:MAG: response regulator [Gammaproteobacteria bacterium]|nr:response regulator [Gammaproteobacteria bacterium]
MAVNDKTSTLILIIEDEKAISESFRNYLDDYGYQVLEAENGRAGLEIFARESPDLVVVDLRMPEVDGLEVLASVKQHSPDTPLIVVSGTGMVGDAVEALRRGAWDYLLKPIEDMSVLRYAVEKALERARLIRENREYQARLEEQVATRTRELREANMELQQVNARLRWIVETTQSISVYSDVNQLGCRLLEEFGNHMQAEGGSLYLTEKGGLRLLHSLDPGHAPAFIPFPLRQGSILEHAMTDGKPLLIPNIAEAGAFFESGWEGYSNGSVMAFPLIDETGDSAGLLSMHSKTPPPFLEQDLEIGSILAFYCCKALRAARATEELRESEERFRKIVASTEAGYFFINKAGRFQDVNDAWLRMHGYSSKGEVVGRHYSLTHIEINELELPENIENLLGGARTGELSRRCKDGTVGYHTFSAKPVAKESKTIGIEGFIIDITERKQAEEEIRRLNEKLEQRVQERTEELSKTNRLMKQAKEAAEIASQAKSDFLSSMSHELRTPLNAVLGYTQILKRDKRLTEQQAKAINTIHHSGEHLLLMINDILDLSKIEARKMELEPSKFNLPDFLMNIVEIVNIRAEQKEIAFEHVFAPGLPSGVWGDKKRLRQIMLNLLNNAIKFTRTGGVTFKVKLQTQNHDNSPPMATLRFLVKDTGIGILPEKLDEIFMPFHQVSDGRMQVEGTGLGLAISQKLVRMMGSELQVKSRVDQGSEFWFDVDLPAVTGPVETIGAEKRYITGFKGERRRLLIVDDKKENRAVLRDALLPLGFDIVEALNGQEALDKVLAVRPHLILLDLLMPKMDGFEFMRRLRLLPELKSLPAIAVSASVHSQARTKILQAGCNAFLDKPVQIDKLLELLHIHLGVEWIYEETVGNGPENKLRPMVFPSQQELKILGESAKIGDITAIRKCIAKIKERGPEFAPFVSRVVYLAEEFHFEKIQDIVRCDGEELT